MVQHKFSIVVLLQPSVQSLQALSAKLGVKPSQLIVVLGDEPQPVLDELSFEADVELTAGSVSPAAVATPKPGVVVGAVG